MFTAVTVKVLAVPDLTNRKKVKSLHPNSNRDHDHEVLTGITHHRPVIEGKVVLVIRILVHRRNFSSINGQIVNLYVNMQMKNVQFFKDFLIRLRYEIKTLYFESILLKSLNVFKPIKKKFYFYFWFKCYY